MNIDVMRNSIMLPPLKVGAYNNTQWLQFIEYRPNVVMVDDNGKVCLIRKREDLEFINQLETLPEALHDVYPGGAPAHNLKP